MGYSQNYKITVSSYDDLKNPYYAGGGAQSVHELAMRLVKKNFSVTCITGKYPGYKDGLVDGVIYRHVGLAGAGPKLGQLVFQLCLPFFVMREKFDIWMESFTPPFSTGMLQLFTVRPVIGLVHMLSAGDMERKYKLPFRLIENMGLKTYKNIIALSETSKKTIQSVNPLAKITVIPNGILIYKKRINTGVTGNILYIGRIEINQKGLDLLLAAFNIVKNSISGNLIIAGSGEDGEVAGLRNMIGKLHLETRVILAGRVEGAEKARLFSEAACVVQPSRFETFSIVALEAMAYGKALICFDISGLEWVPPVCCFKVPPFNMEKLAAGMTKLVIDTGLARKIGQAGRQYARKFNWDTITGRYMDVFYEVMQKYD